jgi:hypothetical protein
MALGFPGTVDLPLCRVIGRDAFIASLDRELQIKVRDRDPKDLSKAYEVAMRVESYLRDPTGITLHELTESRRRERLGAQRARAVQQCAQFDPDNVRDEISQLRFELKRCCQNQDNVSREVGCMRSLLEANIANASRQNRKANVNDTTDDICEKAISHDGFRSTNSQNRAKFVKKECFACGEITHLVRDCPLRKRALADNNAADNRDKSTIGGGAQASSNNVRGVSNNSKNAAYLRMYVGGEPVDFFLGTVSEVCLLPSKYKSASNLMHTEQRLYAANGTAISVDGVICIEATLNGRLLQIEGFASSQVFETILGLNFLRKYNVAGRFAEGMVEIGGFWYKLHAHDVPKACRRVILDSDTVLPPRAEAIVSTYVRFSGEIRRDGEWATQPQQLSACVHAASTLLPQRVLNIPVKLVNTSTPQMNRCLYRWALWWPTLNQWK